MSNNKVYAFLYEGSAETFIIKKLHNEGLLKIDGKTVGDGFIDKRSTANFTYESFLQLGLTEMEKRGCSVILVGDKLSKVKIKFTKNNEEKEEWESLNAKLYYLTIKPDPEILLVHHLGIYDDWIKNKSNKDLIEFITNYCVANKINISNRRKINIKSLDFWEMMFSNVDNLIDSIKKLNKSNSETSNEKDVKILTYKDII